MSRKLGRNDPCWCGSGKKFKHCHLNRDSEERLPFGAIAEKIRKNARHRVCLHPEASPKTCGKVVSAHTLQMSRVLRAISDDDHHVLTFYPPHQWQGRPQVQRRGIHNAATFTAFCDRHDTLTFRLLEIQPFVGSAEQIFLIAYRAICWELYQKTGAIRSGAALRQNIDRGSPEETQRMIQELLAIQDAGFQKGLADLQHTKLQMDRALLNREFSPFASYELEFEGPLSIAATGAVTPNRTIDNQPLQTLHDPNRKTEWLAFGTVPREGGGSVVFFWSKSEKAPLRYIEKLNALNDSQLPQVIAQFLFTHCENTYFAQIWWESLLESQRDFLTGLMANYNPYYFPPSYEPQNCVVKWRVKARRWG